MYMKRFILVNSFALALLGASVASAQPQAHNVIAPVQKHGQCGRHFGPMLTAEQREQVKQVKHDLRAQLQPLFKEKQALRAQIKGKIATPNMQWNEVAVLVDKMNSVNAKIATTVTKTRFDTYQKLGIAVPFGHQRCHGAKHMAARQ